ncbi:efflux RND transporter periplasmic adaptor subunit [Methylovulum psychrotolerans]|uniref:efflux RND transporter periplasmic adaptor subunit n=1 Tax=Methylovulum psychrotolerans TaxID=1704499 RepID=UPI001BFF0906|nr:efflux RND transporter periplasmic adaptor subunit [Methylovulum psychrotolerans]MBT9099806.1 efflux RND transporter periplasmic adaptor subunit [Methylovulum psychrotolerans]
MGTVKQLRILLPIAVLLLGIAAAWRLLVYQPAMPTQTRVSEPPLVSTLTVMPETVRLDVQTQGVVRPRTEIDLVPEVSGKIIFVHPELNAGGFFAKNELLIAIEPRDYDYAVTEAQARIAEAQRLLIAEQAQAVQARNEWKTLGEGQPTPLAMREPQLAEARTKLQAAEADLAKARLKRSRCELRAPFAGRVKEKLSGLGQFVQPGEKLARLYATDIAEIRLPIAMDELAFIDLPLGKPKREQTAATLPTLSLTAQLAGRTATWEGRIVRTEGFVDEANGQLYAIAQVSEPYAQYAGQTPLLVGLFVQAAIHGHTYQNVFVLPPTAINSDQEVWLVDAQQQLHKQKVAILRQETQRILVVGGLKAGDQIVTSGLQVPIMGMHVRLDGATEKMQAASPNTVNHDPS